MLQKIVLASGNAGKLREFSQLFASWDIEVVPQSAFKTPDVEESGLSFIENALIKARHASRVSGLPALADDSGLAVDALGGAPGIYSARYAGPGASDEENNRKLLDAMESVGDSQRHASFHCALAFVRGHDDPVPLVCSAQWRGSILQSPLGEQGFGYDPLFYVESHKMTSAQLPREVKNRISHRARAVRLFEAMWREQMQDDNRLE
ncbi:RdgB/HAM1 family non-canonical purine NTP pyrophosphatase [Microbulbifer thermotolerans]|uniref:dITP/XTP pyrophosphatase n=1 Tax=Microbulbifer thermotolerans TaxID=252514 RepID=A0A143HJ87_MICTH|nr:RdgB/HAM1 family non-canonical purine NTP pyrophosphatase [Microbulbifer thermotolerans]AMX01332.1 non-canonical purine NTP pyrophosphatase [Microbulbifer thermotolerans]WKT60795.1 RdgB/HAM1 family non-canonical purine NTP pyrophosphatase [Microbulbifer thermotolerans]